MPALFGNIIGFKTVIEKEVSRFLSVYLQTIIAPVITTFLFYIVFATVFAGSRKAVLEEPFMLFLAPGLIMMNMAQNAFSNTSSSLMIGKMQNSIQDVLMAPITSFELLSGYVIGGIIRGLMIGFVAMSVMSPIIGLPVREPLVILLFAILGCSMMSVLGVMAGLWAVKFDHIAAITNFVILPMTFLSGTFYLLERLGPLWEKIGHFNPFFYMIDGFRYGFLGKGDADPLAGGVILLVVNIVLWGLAYRLVDTGYKIKS